MDDRTLEVLKMYLDTQNEILKEMVSTNKAILSRLDAVDSRMAEMNVRLNGSVKWIIGALLMAVVFLATGKLLNLGG